MKKIFMLLMLVLLCTTSFSQVRHARANTLSYGSKNENNIIDWKEPITIDVLIDLGVKKVIIHSNKKQEFHIIEYNGEFNEGTSKWYCSDLNGRTCNLLITKINTETGIFTVGIEYSDLIYYYVCKFE